MPTARIARGDLAGLDALEIDAIALSFFRTVKQPLGVAGFVDWRLCGRLGRLLVKQKFNGALGETMLLSALGRVGTAQRIFLFGLGEPRTLSEVEIAVNALKMVTVLADARAEKVAIAGPVPFLAHWLEIAKNASHTFEQVVLLDPDQSLASHAKQLAASAKRGGFELVS